MNRILRFALLAALAVVCAQTAHAQNSTLESCKQNSCSGFGPPAGGCAGSFIYSDISATPVQAYSCKNFVWVAQGGGGGTSSACPLQNATNICITAAPYNAVGDGVTDNSATFRAAIAALGAINGGGTIWIPDGHYMINGALQDTGGANALLPMPKLPNYGGTTATVGLKGFEAPAPNGPPAGAILETTVNSGNLIAGYDSVSGGGFPPFTNVGLDIENLTLIAPHNPGIFMVNAANLMNLVAKNLLILDSAHVENSMPTNSAGGGLSYPTIANNVRITVDQVTVAGFYTGFILGEHSQSVSIYGDTLVNGFVFDPGYNPAQGSAYNGNSISVSYLWCQYCTNQITAGSNVATVNIQVADIEIPGTYGIKDPSNLLRGVINYNNPFTTGGGHCGTPILGATLVQINALQCMLNSSGPVVTGLENWKSQEGSGTTLANSGSDSTNSAAATNVTWAASTGFTGNVATYNGTSSFSVASSAAQTSFNGTTPFTACAWINPILTGISSSLTMISNLDTSGSAIPGFSFRIYGSTAPNPNQLEFYLINSIAATNLIHISGGPSATSGSLNLVCAVYDGTKLASGVHLYMNGVAEGNKVVTDTLTGSTVSPNPVRLGSEANGTGWFMGALGRVRLYNNAQTSEQIAAMYSAGPNAY